MKTFLIRAVAATLFVGGISVLAQLNGLNRSLAGGVMTVLLLVVTTGHLRFGDD